MMRAALQGGILAEGRRRFYIFVVAEDKTIYYLPKILTKKQNRWFEN
jgi:hypothetical protein